MQNKRKVYLINPKFQIKFSLLISLLLFISSLIYPIAIYDLTTTFIQKISSSSSVFAEDLTTKRKSLLIILLFWQIGFTSIVFTICIFFSHKIAGPIYKTKKYLSEIRDGHGRPELSFRKGDYFQELASEFNETFNRIQDNYKKDFLYLDEISQYINNLGATLPEEKKETIVEINKRLAEIQHRFDVI